MTACLDVDLIVEAPAEAPDRQCEYVAEQIQAHSLGGDRRLRVLVRGIQGRPRRLGTAADVLTAGQPHRVRLSEPPISGRDPRLMATCVHCGKVGRYLGPGQGERAAYNTDGIRVLWPVVTAPDWEVDVTSDDIAWEM